MAITINGTGNGKINNTSFSTTTGNAVTTGDSSTVTAGMLSGGQTGSAPAFVTRAWLNMDGTGTISIRGSGNVSSLQDNGVGVYEVNYTTALPNGNYCVTFGARLTSTGGDATGRLSSVTTTTTTRIVSFDTSGNNVDASVICMAIVV